MFFYYFGKKYSMKSTLFLVALSLVMSSSAIAQNCSELKEKKDPFTNKTEKTAKVTIGNLMTKWSVDINQSDGQTYMKWGIAMQGDFKQVFEQGTQLLLKLEDGSVLQLPTSEPSSPVTKVTDGGAGTVNIFTIYYLKFDLTKETLGKLAKSEITDIKVNVPGQEIKNPKIKSNQMGKLQDIFSCLLSS